MTAPDAIADIIATAQRPANDRVARYTARLDIFLDALPVRDRRPFLDREYALWETRYRNWTRSVDSGGEDRGYSAWDFTLTIAEISKRRAECP